MKCWMGSGLTARSTGPLLCFTSHPLRKMIDVPAVVRVQRLLARHAAIQSREAKKIFLLHLQSLGSKRTTRPVILRPTPPFEGGSSNGQID